MVLISIVKFAQQMVLNSHWVGAATLIHTSLGEKMKPVYLYDVGIKPWEQTKTVIDSRFATITIVQHSVNELFALWINIVVVILGYLPRALKWRTVGHSIQGSKVQELKLLKQLKSDLKNEDLLEKNEGSSILSYIKKLSEPLEEFDLNTITQPLYTILLFLPDETPNLRSIWNVYKNFDTGLDARGIEAAICKYDDMLICRVTESDSHVSAQFIGAVAQVDKLLAQLNDLNITRVEEGEIASIIND